jgi:hypothetical protein
MVLDKCQMEKMDAGCYQAGDVIERLRSDGTATNARSGRT